MSKPINFSKYNCITGKSEYNLVVHIKLLPIIQKVQFGLRKVQIEDHVKHAGFRIFLGDGYGSYFKEMPVNFIWI